MRWLDFRCTWALVALFATACGGSSSTTDTGDPDPDPDGPTPETITQTMAGVDVEVTNNPLSIVIKNPDGSVVLESRIGGSAAPYGAAAFREVTEDPARQVFGNFVLSESDEASWGDVPYLELGTNNAQEITFSLSNGGTGSITAVADRTLQIKFSGPGNRSSVAFQCADGEAFMGFGGQAIDVDHRGHTFQSFVTEGGNGRLDGEEPYPDPFYIVGTRHQTSVAIPFFVSSEGYGILGDGVRNNIFSMCQENQDAWRYETWSGDMSFHVFVGDTPLSVLERHTELVGRPPVPPNFVFAPWTDAIRGSANVEAFMDLLRDNDVPVSAVWSEDWAGASGDGTNFFLDQNWAHDDVFYPDLPVLTDNLHDIGIKFLAYFSNFAFRTPATSPEYRSTHYDEGEANGYYFTDSDGDIYTQPAARLPFQTAYVDLYNPDAVDWMIGYMNEAMDDGVDGWMADYGEWVMLDMVNVQGIDPYEAHNRYPVEWKRVSERALGEREAMDNIERIAFHRSGFNGSQQFGHVVMWGGDQATSFETGDGLPSAIAVGINQGVSGLPFYGSDIAGYAEWRSNPDQVGVADGPCVSREVFFRWTSFGAFSPIMRTHHGRRATQNWTLYNVLFGPPGPPGGPQPEPPVNERCPALPAPDPSPGNESLIHWKRYSKLHTQLFPYQLENAREAAARGAPLMRAMALMFPNDMTTWSLTDQYMFGPDLLVAPVIEEGATSRQIYFPEGTWVPLEGGDPVVGPTTATVSAALEDIPVYARAGTVLSLLPSSVDTLVRKSDYASPSQDADVVYLEDVGSSREVWAYLGAGGEFTETDAGLSFTMTYDHDPSGAASVTVDGAAVTACNAETPVPPCGEVDVAQRVAVVLATANAAVAITDGSGEAARVTPAGGAGGRDLRVVIRW